MGKVIELKKRIKSPTPEEIRLHNARKALYSYLKSGPSAAQAGVLLNDVLKYLTFTQNCDTILKQRVNILIDKILKEKNNEN
jgi:hypothetical protein